MCWPEFYTNSSYIYNNIAAIIIVISRTSNGILYCRSRDLQQSLNHPTHFCTFTGEYKLKTAIVLLSIIIVITFNMCTSYRNSYLLLFISLGRLMVMPSGGFILEDEVSLACPLIPKGPPYEIHPHQLCSCLFSSPSCPCDYIDTLLYVWWWWVFSRSHGRWCGIRYHSVSTATVHGETRENNILPDCCAQYHHSDDRNSSNSFPILDYSQGIIPLQYPNAVTIILYRWSKWLDLLTDYLPNSCRFRLVEIPLILCIFLLISLHVAQCYFVWLQHHGLFTDRHSQSKNKISAAERKILIVFVYEVIVLLLILYGRILDVRDRERFLSEINCYFQCESNGVDHGNPCDTTTYMNPITLTMTTISYILLGLFPLVNFLFIVNLRVLNQHLEKWLRLCFRKSPRKEKVVSSSVTPNQDTPSTSSNSAV